MMEASGSARPIAGGRTIPASPTDPRADVSRCLDGTIVSGVTLDRMSDEQDRAIAAARGVLGAPLSKVTSLSNDKRRNLILRATTPSGSVIVKATRDKAYDGASV